MAIFAKLISFKTIDLNMVSIFFHEIFRINVDLHFDFKFWSGILSKAFKIIGSQILKNARQILELGRQIGASAQVWSYCILLITHIQFYPILITTLCS